MKTDPREERPNVAHLNQRGAVETIGRDNAYRYALLPLDRRGQTIFVAATETQPLYVPKLEEDLRVTIRVEKVLPKGEILSELRKLYPGDAAFSIGDRPSSDELGGRKIFEEILDLALARHASDIHVKAVDESRNAQVQLRFDKRLRNVRVLTREEFERLDFFLRKQAQTAMDRRAFFEKGAFPFDTQDSRRVHVRVSFAPGYMGTKLAVRLLSSVSTFRRFAELGLPPGLRERYVKVLASPEGAHAFAGPTGAGKTTSLFAVVLQSDLTAINAMSVEDPVEVIIPAMTQVEVDVARSITFETALREFLGVDPDLIVCSEVRDKESASIVMDAGNRGWPVFYGLHAGDAIRAIDRLAHDLAVSRSTIGSSLKTVLGQRTVRKLCERCKEPLQIPMAFSRLYDEVIEGAGVSEIYQRREGGCERCYGEGTLGLVGVFELLVVSDQIGDAIVHGASRAALKMLAQQEGYAEMRYHAASLIAQGLTSIDEVASQLRLEPV